jgi:hypothetical protein
LYRYTKGERVIRINDFCKALQLVSQVGLDTPLHHVIYVILQ